MSRSRHHYNFRSPGTEYWSSRYYKHGESPGRVIKDLTHRLERRTSRDYARYWEHDGYEGEEPTSTLPQELDAGLCYEHLLVEDSAHWDEIVKAYEPDRDLSGTWVRDGGTFRMARPWDG